MVEYTDEEIAEHLLAIAKIPRAPVLEVRLDQFVIQCPYCGKKHYHGRDGGLGHRAAHCLTNNVNTTAGYIVYVQDRMEEMRALTRGTKFLTTRSAK